MDTAQRDAGRHKPQNTFRLLTTAEAAEALSQSKRTIQKLVAERELGHLKLGKSLRFSMEDIQAYVDKNRIKARGWKERK
jgi:excisionase family DNA binding protein